MIHGEPLEMNLVDWIGQIKFEEGYYRVDLILEDKSSYPAYNYIFDLNEIDKLGNDPPYY